jgi:hypothetical protein
VPNEIAAGAWKATTQPNPSPGRSGFGGLATFIRTRPRAATVTLKLAGWSVPDGELTMTFLLASLALAPQGRSSANSNQSSLIRFALDVGLPLMTVINIVPETPPS